MRDTGGRPTHLLLFSQQLNFIVEYKQGATNTNADALSKRPPADSPPITTISTDMGPPSTNMLVEA